MKIAFAGFDLMYPAFEALSENNEIIKLFTCEVDGVYETNVRVISLADRLRAPYTLARITRADTEELIARGCELLVSAGYYYRIPVDERLPMVNIHPSLLPYGRGAWPMPLAILDRLPESGATIHKTAKDFDAGDILLQRSFRLSDDETLESFMDKVNALLPDMVSELTRDFDRLWQSATPQDGGVYQKEPSPEQYVLTPADTVEYADRVLRAFYGFPCCYDDSKEKREIIRVRAYHGKGTEDTLPLADGYIG